ncbi:MULTISPECIES: septum site-determining protein Ssd [unclassified Luteococcus]|uniref:septum site-determining protein Ssd n=1 Tax=unclassified Luteococcus TaxID=2639923 RepID=UPI00313BE316
MKTTMRPPRGSKSGSTAASPRPPGGSRRVSAGQSSGPAAAPAPPLLVARDSRVIEAALAAAAAAGVEPRLVREPSQIRAAWRSSPCVLVGVEMAPLVCGIALEPRPGIHLVGTSLAELADWSALLQASVLVLPEQSALLTSVLDQGQVGAGEAQVVRVVGGSGGLGVSTLCCALAQQASERGLRAAAVELDPTGGGLDLIFGAETVPGWRWHDLRSAAGHIDSLVGQLPNVSGVDVVAHSRPDFGGPPGADGMRPGLPGAEAVRSVLECLSRTHDLVVLDGGSGGDQAVEGWPGQRQLLICGADVRGVVAAQSRAWALGLHDIELVVRTGAARRIDPETVAETLGIALLGSFNDDRAVTRAAEQAVPVGRGRRGYARQVGRLLEGLLAGPGGVDLPGGRAS